MRRRLWVLCLLVQRVLGLFSPGPDATPRALLAQPSSRRALLAGLGLAPAAAAAASSAPPRRDGIVSPTGATTLEVARCGGALCVDYEVDDRLLRLNVVSSYIKKLGAAMEAFNKPTHNERAGAARKSAIERHIYVDFGVVE